MCHKEAFPKPPGPFVPLCPHCRVCRDTQGHVQPTHPSTASDTACPPGSGHRSACFIGCGSGLGTGGPGWLCECTSPPWHSPGVRLRSLLPDVLEMFFRGDSPNLGSARVSPGSRWSSQILIKFRGVAYKASNCKGRTGGCQGSAGTWGRAAGPPRPHLQGQKAGDQGYENPGDKDWRARRPSGGHRRLKAIGQGKRRGSPQTGPVSQSPVRVPISQTLRGAPGQRCLSSESCPSASQSREQVEAGARGGRGRMEPVVGDNTVVTQSFSKGVCAPCETSARGVGQGWL